VCPNGMKMKCPTAGDWGSKRFKTCAFSSLAATAAAAAFQVGKKRNGTRRPFGSWILNPES